MQLVIVCYNAYFASIYILLTLSINEGWVDDSCLFSFDHSSHVEEKRNGGSDLIQGMVQIVYLHIPLGIEWELH